MEVLLYGDLEQNEGAMLLNAYVKQLGRGSLKQALEEIGVSYSMYNLWKKGNLTPRQKVYFLKSLEAVRIWSKGNVTTEAEFLSLTEDKAKPIAFYAGEEALEVVQITLKDSISILKDLLLAISNESARPFLSKRFKELKDALEKGDFNKKMQFKLRFQIGSQKA